MVVGVLPGEVTTRLASGRRRRSRHCGSARFLPFAATSNEIPPEGWKKAVRKSTPSYGGTGGSNLSSSTGESHSAPGSREITGWRRCGLFNDLISQVEDARRDSEAERLASIEIDQLKEEHVDAGHVAA
jgi:hypothetical protein